MKQIDIMLVDDHQIVRDGINSLLAEVPGINVVAEAWDEVSLMEQLDLQSPDIIMMDISLPGKSGIELAQCLSSRKNAPAIIFLSMYLNEEFIINALRAGAKGYLPKDSNLDEMISAIHDVYGGKEYFPRHISDVILKNYMKQVSHHTKSVASLQKELTKRETEVLKLFAEGLTNQQIADKLFISIRTAECHKTNIMHKLDLNSTVDLVKYAIRNQIVEI